MADKLKVTKLEIKTKDGKVIELSLKESKELYKQLRELFGEKKTVISPYPVVIEREVYPWQRPYYIDWRYYSDTTGQVEVYSDNSNIKVSYSGNIVK